MAKKDKKVINIKGRMAFIEVDESDLETHSEYSYVKVLGLFDRYIIPAKKFTGEEVEGLEQLNILKYLNSNIGLYPSTKKMVSVRYVVSEKPIEDIDEEIANIVISLEGDLGIEHCSHFSDLTGYLWTDSEMNVGGHDLLAELESHLVIPGDRFWDSRTYEECPERYLWLEVTVHE